MATHSSILAWRIPWTEELGGLQSMGHKELDTTEPLHLHFHFEHSLALLFFGIGMKTTFSSPVATAESSKFAGIFSAAP